ncbi:hypothetical protein [Sphingomonas turrisvirgatae]|uniref:ATPase n=1 Tax=Sphingomonas turrisvirgatae TaxID=1888892 RepID=A0A1E3LSV9_9SPHN|nr:hypothetical protein [Sphingomonas turrisvirgatae]ODP36827.1 hypothetical protein BFL28_03700 [Sphingomonas turrisvirgatae]
MNGGKNTAGLAPVADDGLLLVEEPAPTSAAHPSYDPAEDAEDEEAFRTPNEWAVPVLALGLVTIWFGVMGWLLGPTLASPQPPAQLVQLIAALCVPPALVGILWLLAQRSSRSEARRFRDTARAMRSEAASLERTVAVLARKIEENRAALAAQTSAMMAMGDGAAERLQAVSNGMAAEARAIEASGRLLVDSAAAAERSVNIVLASLPRAHETMTGMAATLDSAGMKASEHAAALDAQLSALTERGRIADEVASGAATRLAAHITRMEATGETAGTKLEGVAAQMAETVDAMLDRAAAAVDEARKGIAAQGEAMLAMLAANQASLDAAGRESIEAVGNRVAEVEGTILRIGDKLGEEQTRIDIMLASVTGGIAQADGQLSALHAGGMERTQALAASISALDSSATAMTETLRIGDSTARSVIATAEALLTAMDASAREIDETMPEALLRLEDRITATRTVIGSAKPELLALVTAAESTHDAIEAIADVVSKQRDTLLKTQASLIETLDTGHEKTDQLEEIVDRAIGNARRFAEEAAPQLVDALLRIRETAKVAAEQARETLAGLVPEASRQLEQAGSSAMRRAIDSGVRQQLVELGEVAEASVTAAARASERLTQQMLTIGEASAAVERRIEEARAEREAADQDNFARRVSLLVEALNSASIDITKAFAHEVTDSAWAAYLKGDRGVFTRRAVRLLDSGDARDIASLYDGDSQFREQVNRYIHDFEAMLRQVLALRDGSPLGVTLLSSDMGKLYVALAQAIERLRA